MNTNKVVTANLYRNQADRRNVSSMMDDITRRVKSGLARRRGNMAALQAQIASEIAPLLREHQNAEWGAVWRKAA